MGEGTVESLVLKLEVDPWLQQAHPQTDPWEEAWQEQSRWLRALKVVWYLPEPVWVGLRPELRAELLAVAGVRRRPQPEPER